MNSSSTRDVATVFGVPVDRLTMDESVDLAVQLIEQGGCHQHVVVNAAKLVAAYSDVKTREILSSCDMVNADGQSVVWASRILGDPLPERVAGIDFMDRLVDRSVTKNFSIYLLGAEERVLSSVCAVLRDRGARVVGQQNGYWRNSMADADLVRSISSLKPNIIFVALPSPMKENFLHDNLDALNVNLCVGVGGSFDVISGKTRRAPVYLQRLGLEWAYRLMQEPRRMLKRYIVGNTQFLMILSREYLRQVGSRRKE